MASIDLSPSYVVSAIPRAPTFSPPSHPETAIDLHLANVVSTSPRLPTFTPPSFLPININLTIDLPSLREVFSTEAAPHPATSVSPEAAFPPANSVSSAAASPSANSTSPRAASPPPIQSLLRPLLPGPIPPLLSPLLPRPPLFHSPLAIAEYDANAMWSKCWVLPGSEVISTHATTHDADIEIWTQVPSFL
ncbi:uncharacterized protein N7515_009677 [Penicillium bovifimosum]|uniref:Uncharacterized protein n=1 Tax=Penicillium bovifimosum TaxID=126998 RepID=A0A9W9GHB9_9EURO|nr:uncharacterized protein N7515_009677 [Penicillium bovifimosum]KAJ5120289.1 hypothetical protein N7515_009677 [Penicillium bovifimosum]